MIKLLSWNVNGIRSASTKGLFEWMEASNADVVCLQETKAHPDQLGKEFFSVGSYAPLWSSAKKRGYSGVATYTRVPPRSVRLMEVDRFDHEGRVLVTEFDNLVLFNCYFPNSQEAGARIDYKVDFCRTLTDQAEAYRAQGKTVVICGDYNVAHQPIDLERPDDNTGNPGYLPQEREWMGEFIGRGWVDTFREFHPEPKRYSWWSYRTRARERNIGWRIDYFCINGEARGLLHDADIQDQVFGSDHCPVSLTLEGELS